jgi:uncharacterized protein YjbJ (UPF0337 family)
MAYGIHQNFSQLWPQLKDKVRQQWGVLSEVDLDQVAGKRDELLRRLKARYNTTYERIDREVAALELSHHAESRNPQEPRGISND